MLIDNSNPSLQTIIFSVIFFSILLLSIKKAKDNTFFSKDVTNELKGFAIFAVIFAHIGYYLASDNRFLFPLSTLGGVGVNIFLFLSGYGLTLSQIHHPLSPLTFYKKRLLKLFSPLWLAISLVLLLDFILLSNTYPLKEIIYSFFGFFPRADVTININSPLWYFTIILFYYLIFPLAFFTRIPLISSLLILIISLFILKLPLPVDKDVIKLYALHYLAFPAGMVFAEVRHRFSLKLHRLWEIVILIISILIFIYTFFNSGVGKDPDIEQVTSLIAVFSLISIFLFSKIYIKLFSLFGIYSYEIYLFHWPILSRFNLFLKLPAFLSVILNLVLFIFLGYILQKLVQKVVRRL